MSNKKIITCGALLKNINQTLLSFFQGTTNNQTISYIRVTDQYLNGSGGYTYLTSGGINYNSTTLEFKSQRGRGLRFIVEIFSNKTNPRPSNPNPYYYLIKA